jgi:hypothetical protein
VKRSIETAYSETFGYANVLTIKVKISGKKYLARLSLYANSSWWSA